MKKVSIFLIFAIIICLGINFDAPVSAKQKQINTEAITKEVEKAIHGSIAWVKTKDFELLYSIIMNDSTYLEVHPEGKTTFGFDNFKKAEKFWGSSDFQHVGYDISDLHITLSKSRDVAWFYCILNDRNTWKGQPAEWLNTRWTGVLQKINGKWRMMQGHFSYEAKE